MCVHIFSIFFISNFDKLDKEQQNNIKAILKVTKTIVEQFNESNKTNCKNNKRC